MRTNRVDARKDEKDEAEVRWRDRGEAVEDGQSTKSEFRCSRCIQYVVILPRSLHVDSESDIGEENIRLRNKLST